MKQQEVRPAPTWLDPRVSIRAKNALLDQRFSRKEPLSGSELKVLVAVLYNYMQFGGGEPTSLTDIEHMTGLSRPTVIATLNSLSDNQVLERQAEGMKQPSSNS